MTKNSETILAFAQLHTQMFKKIDRFLSVHSIYFTEFMVMHTLFQSPEKMMRRIDLAEATGMSASGVTRLLNPMEKLHLVQKEQNARDARVSLVKLSKDGEEVYQDAMTSFMTISDDVLQPLNKQQVDTLLDLCTILGK